MKNKKKNVKESNICKQKAKAKFFHSKCCNSHFEGIISEDGNLIIACENCGKHCGIFYTTKIENPSAPIILPARECEETRECECACECDDIYEGEDLLVFDGDNYFFNTLNTTLHFNKEEWIGFKKDLTKLADL